MDSLLPVPPSHRHLRRGPLRQGPCGVAISFLGLVAAAAMQAPAHAGGMGAIVRAFCLSAFENEMAQAGKRPPQGMASFACGCVEEQLRSGSTIDTARRECRQQTARRYPI